MSLRLGDHLLGSPNVVVDQSLLAIRPAISFFVEGAVDGSFAPLSFNDILIAAYGTGGKRPKRYTQTYLSTMGGRCSLNSYQAYERILGGLCKIQCWIKTATLRSLTRVIDTSD